MDIPKTFSDLLNTIGSPIFIGLVITFLLKEVPAFAKAKPWVKWTVTLLLSIFLPVASRALMLYLPPDVRAFMDQWWPTVAIGLGVWLSSQLGYQFITSKQQRKTSVFIDRNAPQG